MPTQKNVWVSMNQTIYKWSYIDEGNILKVMHAPPYLSL